MIGTEFGNNTAVFLGLFLFGLAFNAVIGYAEGRTWLKGYMYAAVALGVAGTLAGVWLIDPQAAELTFWAFVASGLPMAIGAMYRHAREREEQIIQARQDAKGRDDTTQEVASRR